MLEYDFDKPREECGVFGIYVPNEQTARLTFQGLRALQHRGQESAGISVYDGYRILSHRGLGLVKDVFTAQILEGLTGSMAIGHVRYSTTGSIKLVNAQPLQVDHQLGTLALAHNGNLTNAQELRTLMAKQGIIFRTSVDSEIILKAIASYYCGNLEKAVQTAMLKLKGAFALVILSEGKLIGVRDPYGLRPLCIGRLGSAYCLASESCALSMVGAEFLRDVQPGEIITIDDAGLHSYYFHFGTIKAGCAFEYIYFASPQSTLDQLNVWETRQRMGVEMAKECPIDADVVIPVPNSGRPAAQGYASTLGISCQEGLYKKTNNLRSFIEPTKKKREAALNLNLFVDEKVVRGQKVIMVDDSIVRGTTSTRLVKLLRECGAKEVHLLIASPPVRFPCYYGIDTAAPGSLIAARLSPEGVQKFIGADTLYYLSEDGLRRSLRDHSVCLACFNGNYPASIPSDKWSKYSLESMY